MSIFKIPKKVLDHINQTQKDFLWIGVEDMKRMALVAQKKLCHPLQYDGLGIRNLKNMNLSLMSKLAQKIAKGVRNPWVEVIQAKYILSFSFLKDLNLQLGSTFCNGIQCTKVLISNPIHWLIGSGKHVNFWKDSWLQKSAMSKHAIISLVRRDLTHLDGDRIQDYIMVEEHSMWKPLTIINPS